MDRKAKKRLEVLRKKLQTVQMQLAGARKQEDEPGEVEKYEAELRSITDEIEKLKGS